MRIKISKKEDWQNLSNEGLTTVIDPMVFRCGEFFLKGAKESENEIETHNLLMKNTHALGMFFDSLVLNEKIPVFNYGDTFDMGLNFDQRTLTRINEYEKVLFDVDVEYEPYHEIKTAAIVELSKLYKGPNKISKEMTSDIVEELGFAGYRWTPSIHSLEHELLSDEEKTLAAYLLGAIIFGGYAQQMESEHVLQPKRSRILLALAIGSKSAKYELENHLFDELKKRANTKCEDLPWMPTFFPYLLGKADSSKSLLDEVIKLRSSIEIKEYRIWLREVIDDFARNGRIGLDKTKSVRAIAKHIDRKLGTIPSLPKLELKASVADVVEGKIPGEIDLTPTIENLWGWFLQNLPGKRYRKILTRAIIADHEYKKLDTRISNFWKNT